MKLRNIIKKIIVPTPLIGWLSNIMIAIPRIVAGLLLSFDFGSSKFGMPWTESEQNLSLFEVSSWFEEDIALFGFPFSFAPRFFAWIAAASEAIGGLFLALGLGTRMAAALIMSTMMVAIFYQKWGDSVWEMLPAMGFLWVSIYALTLGSGKLGIDYFIYQKRDN